MRRLALNENNTAATGVIMRCCSVIFFSHLDLPQREGVQAFIVLEGCVETQGDKEADLRGQRVPFGCQKSTAVWQDAEIQSGSLCDAGVSGHLGSPWGS